MCLIVFSYKQHPKYDLILAANRDEEYARPTREAKFWDEYPDILAGKDIKAGGTWFGVTRGGSFAALTNFRDPTIQKENPPSRGHLVLNYLKSSKTPDEYLKQVDSEANRYMGFSLLVGTPRQLHYYSNQQQKILQLDSGLYGLSNHLLDTPWPKVQRAKQGLQELTKNEKVSMEALFDLLTDDRQAPDDELPSTGVPREIEKKVSPVFIKGENYGTRCSTVLLLSKNGEVTFAERRFKAGTMEVEDENSYHFSLSAQTNPRSGV